MVYLPLIVFLAVIGIGILRNVSLKQAAWSIAAILLVIAVFLGWQNRESWTKEGPPEPEPGIWRMEVEVLGFPETLTDYPASVWIKEGKLETVVVVTREKESLWSTDSGRFLTKSRRLRSGEVPIGGTWELRSSSNNSFEGVYEYIAPRGDNAGEKREGRFTLYRL